MDIFESLGKLVPKNTIDKLYDDALSAPAKEIGKLSTDALKTARLLLAPLQFGAAFQDRLEKICERIGQRIPEERRVQAPLEIVGPTLEKMRYVCEDTLLWDMFEEILTKSIDSEARPSIHPSFGHIVSLLSRDEAWILYRLRERQFKIVDYLDFDREANRFSNRIVEQSDMPSEELFLPKFLELSFLSWQS